jgi:hypothetical protein
MLSGITIRKLGMAEGAAKAYTNNAAKNFTVQLRLVGWERDNGCGAKLSTRFKTVSSLSVCTSVVVWQ